MVLSHRHNYVFSVIPKTGSGSLRMALKQYTDVGWPLTDFDQHVPLAQAALKEDYFDFYKEYFSFSFVRNPYDRLYSGFLQDSWASKNLPAWKKVKHDIFESIGYDFNRYILDFVSQSDILNDWSWICFCPMWSFTELDNFELDYIGKYENYNHEIEKLSKLLNIDIRINQSINTTDQSHSELKYLKHYSAETISCINEIYDLDFAKFGYDKVDITKLSF